MLYKSYAVTAFDFVSKRAMPRANYMLSEKKSPGLIS